ncbi:MAG: putative adenylate/guanylate cyclase with Chase sensor [Spirochaetes bacterium]|nr:MAG: putative adenylate/guanylate cyclase with Chase sensor [Spirochaetota bacterium]
MNAAQVLEAALAPAKKDSPKGDGYLRPDDFANRYVFIGFSAPGLLDRQAVPTDSAMPGVEIHATFVADYLGEGLLQTPEPLVLAAVQGLFIAGASSLATWGTNALFLALGGVFLVLAPLAMAYAAFAAGFVFPSGFLLLGGLMAFFIGISLSYLAEGRTRRFLRKSFSQYLAAEVIDELVKDPSRLRLGGESRVITAFFSDIRDFTTLSEGIDPPRLAAFMNTYLGIVTAQILEEGGTVDKYVGDAVVAFWNAPLPRPDHANRAVRAALRCQTALKKAKEEFAALGTGLPFTRIGIHTGVAIVGNMGSSARFNYTAIGDVMNTASRLESANKSLGTSILVSRETVAACTGDFEEVEFRPLGRIAVKGKTKEIEVWEAALAGEGEKDPRIEAWEGVRTC